MRVTVLHRGAPVGSGQLKVDDIIASGEFTSLAGYDAVRPIVRDAQRAMSNFGFLPPDGAFVGGIDASGDSAGKAATQRADDLSRELELRGADGALIAHEWLELWDTDTGFYLLGQLTIEPAGSHAGGVQ